jgi:eukaryotic-like serine/threonine-protein kinase
MEPGQRVAPHLELVRLLDEGSMGSVWVADHLTLRTQVAVKFMSPAIAKDPSFIARFTREAQAAAQIKSMHVVQTIDHGITAEGVPYIAMELLEGEPLLKRLRQKGSLSTADTAAIVTQVGKALGKAHQLGIVHRDIKPGNIFLLDADGDLFVKLLDFGVAKQEQDGLSMTQTNDKVGTPFYMSPEQLISAKHVDFQTDLWSVAVVAYHAVVGQVPFNAKTFVNLCLAITKGVFAPPSSVRPDLPRGLDAFFLRALAHQRSARFESAKHLAEEFERAVRT